MRGMDRLTGKWLEGFAYAAQCYRDAILTAKKTRPLRRWYGSDVPDIQDAPINSLTFVKLAVACAEACDQIRHIRTRQRILSLERFEVPAADEGGNATLRLHVRWHEDGTLRTVEI